MCKGKRRERKNHFIFLHSGVSKFLSSRYEVNARKTPGMIHHTILFLLFAQLLFLSLPAQRFTEETFPEGFAEFYGPIDRILINANRDTNCVIDFSFHFGMDRRYSKKGFYEEVTTHFTNDTTVIVNYSSWSWPYPVSFYQPKIPLPMAGPGRDSAGYTIASDTSFWGNDSTYIVRISKNDSNCQYLEVICSYASGKASTRHILIATDTSYISKDYSFVDDKWKFTIEFSSFRVETSDLNHKDSIVQIRGSDTLITFENYRYQKDLHGRIKRVTKETECWSNFYSKEFAVLEVNYRRRKK
jgi:hypothetical protein